MFRFPSTLSGLTAGRLAAGVGLPAGVLMAAAPWAAAVGLPAAALATLAALGLAHYAVVLLEGHLIPATTPGLLGLVFVGGLLGRRGGRRRFRPPRLRVSLWDGISALFLASLLVPTVFPYIHFDTKAIWACRAEAMARTGRLSGLKDCVCPTYPPFWSLLLWIGSGEPVFQGRPLAWLLVLLFVLLLRERVGRLDAALAGPALLFFVSTVNVWQGSAMYYANVPLMVFLSAGSLLALQLPREAEPGPSGAEIAAGALCLSAATLVRPDGAYYLAVVALAAGWWRLRGGRVAIWPFLVAFGVGATWLLRPASLRQAPSFFATGHGSWRLAAPAAGRATLDILLTFLNGWQGQWLSHKGMGTAFYLLACLALLRCLCRGRRRRRDGFDEGSFYGLVTACFLAAVPLCYLLVPFTGDPRVACPTPDATYLDCYISFIRVGLGRMTIHLYPLMILFGVATIRELREGVSPPDRPGPAGSMS